MSLFVYKLVKVYKSVGSDLNAVEIDEFDNNLIDIITKNTLLTFISVHWADSKTDISKVKTFLLFKGTLIFGYV